MPEKFVCGKLMLLEMSLMNLTEGENLTGVSLLIDTGFADFCRF